MKFIFVVVLASLFGISWADITVSVSGVSWPNPGRKDPRPDEPTFTHYTVVEFLLVFQYEKRVAKIFDSLKECNGTWAVPLDEAKELFENPPPGLLRLTNKPAKCLIDCVMRKNGVMTDAGFQVDEYLLQFKQLRLNYTSYDVNKIPNEEKQEVLNAIMKFAEGNPKNFEMIKAYEWAANECKDRKDPQNDKYVKAAQAAQARGFPKIFRFKKKIFFLVAKHHGSSRVALLIELETNTLMLRFIQLTYRTYNDIKY